MDATDDTEDMEVASLEPCIQLPLEVKTFNELVSKAQDWAIMHGAAMRSKTAFNPDSLTFAPFTLFPSTFPKKEFNKALNLQPVLNLLVHRIAHDHEFLRETLENTIKVDDFTARLYKIYETVHNEGFAQKVSLGLFRGDYFLDDYRDDRRVKQVEINTVSTSLAGLSTCFSTLHRYVLRELGRSELLDSLPENTALSGLCEGIIAAWNVYEKPEAVILFVVEDVTYNICDQRFHEFYIQENYPRVKVIRRTLTEIHAQGKLSEQRLLLDGIEVAVVYFRSGYEPAQYHGEEEWDARLLMERSLAIKCPSIHYHLAGTKKVQQVLSESGVVEKFLTEPGDATSIRETFTGIYSLDLDHQGHEAAAMGITNPDSFVLKPQREGGGNNVYGQQVRTHLKAMLHSEERMGWILMKRLRPPIQETYVIRPGTPSKAENTQTIVSELGVFGVILGSDEKILRNQQCGHMLRSKLSSADEGGVAAGAGCLDSPFLVD